MNEKNNISRSSIYKVYSEKVMEQKEELKKGKKLLNVPVHKKLKSESK